jgi:hypothetical protein
MIGQVVYKNGSTEPILMFSQTKDGCEVFTASNHYAYKEWIRTHESGYQFRVFSFYTYVGYPTDWARTEIIKEFRFMEEDADEYRDKSSM